MDSDNTPSQEASEAAELLPTVTQRAREAAADLHAVDLGEPLSEADWFYLNEIRAGRNDEDDGVQAFARYERDTLARQQTGGGEEHVTWEKALLDQFYIGPWVVCDATDEVFLSDGAWREDIWEASTHSRETAEELALKHGGADHPEIRAWPYARFDKPTEWRLLEENAKLRAALSAPPTDETARSADVGEPWRPIASFPKDRGRYLISHWTGRRVDWVSDADWNELKCCWGKWDGEKLTHSFIPTHWMPMPALTTPPADDDRRFQDRVNDWMLACFGPEISEDRLERGDRFIEEALELAQTVPGFTAERAHALVHYVFGRDVGERHQEVGGVMVTLAALCNTFGVSIPDASECELARVWTKVDAIRAKQAAKPTGSALPVACVPADDGGLRSALEKIEDVTRYVPNEYAKEAWNIARQALGGR